MTEITIIPNSTDNNFCDNNHSTVSTVITIPVETVQSSKMNNLDQQYHSDNNDSSIKQNENGDDNTFNSCFDKLKKKVEKKTNHCVVFVFLCFLVIFSIILSGIVLFYLDKMHTTCSYRNTTDNLTSNLTVVNQSFVNRRYDNDASPNNEDAGASLIQGSASLTVDVANSDLPMPIKVIAIILLVMVGIFGLLLVLLLLFK
jgi:hypothetical protein